MEKTRRAGVIAGALACFQIFAASPRAHAEETRRSSLQVILDNRANTPAEVLQAAQATASRIYSALGVDLMWTAASTDTATAHRVTLVVSPHALAGATRHALGTAIANRSSAGRRAYVYLDRVTAFANSVNSPVTSMLAHVIAHELGHLLIGHSGHAVTGLMSTQWKGAEIERLKNGGLTFTGDHAKTIQARLGVID